MVTSISEDISGQTHHQNSVHHNQNSAGSARPKLSYLRSLSKPRPPPAVVITDDSEAYPDNVGGGVNPSSVFDVLFSRPFGSPSANNRGSCGGGGNIVGDHPPVLGSPGNSTTVVAVPSSASAAFNNSGCELFSSPCAKANGVCSGSPLRHLGRSFSRDSSAALHGAGSFATDNSFDASDNTGDPEAAVSALRSNRRKCCSEQHRRVVQGIFLTLIVAGSWVGSAHLLKRTYMSKGYSMDPLVTSPAANESNRNNFVAGQQSSVSHPDQPAAPFPPAPPPLTSSAADQDHRVSRKATDGYNAPFFTTWFCTLWNSFFFPVYLVTSCCGRPRDKSSSKKLFVESIQQFQEKGFTVLQFFGRCGFFSILWVATNYMFVHSLRLLHTTFVVALYCSNVSFVYLLSWVVLHDQFVGIRIVAVILCNTGIALLAYMDGVSRASTLGGVVLAAAAAAGSAVYKVFFKKLVGEVSFGQLSLFFSLVGILNLLLLWPIVLTLYFSNAEIFSWTHLPWGSLGGAAALSLVANLLGNFGVIWTYEIFLTLGLVFAVPASAVIDVIMYDVHFEGMKLSGIILIAVGFFLVMFPPDWPDYLTLLLRWRRKQRTAQQEALTAHRSRLRTPSGQVK